MNTTPSHSNRLNGFPDNKRILSLVLKYWYVFVISVAIAYAVAFIRLKFTPTIFQGNVTILLETSKDKRITQSEMVEGFAAVGESNNIDNQSLIIQSRKTIKKTIDRLDFGISVFQKSRFIDRELYGEVPFKINIDSLAPQILNTPITIVFNSNNTISLRINSDGGSLFLFKGQKYLNNVDPFNFEKTINYGEKVVEPFISFSIVDILGQKPLLNHEYYIVFNSNDEILTRYAGTVSVNPLREGSSIITISTTGMYAKKISRFLDQLSVVYLEQNLEKKNDYAIRTLGFIQIQLLQIADSLNKTRDQLMAFRMQNKFVNPSAFSEKISEEYFALEKERMEFVYKLDFFATLKKKLKEFPLNDDYLLPVLNDDSNPFINSLSTDLLKLNSELQQRETFGSESNPGLIALEAQIKNQKETIDKLIDKYIQSLKLKIEEIDNAKASTSKQMDDMPMIERTYMDLERTYKLNDAIYTFLLQKQSETQISKSSTTPDNEIIDSARVFGPISPNSRQTTTQAIIIGLLLPLVLIVAIDFLNNHIHTQDELKLLVPEIPIIGLIPQNKSSNQNVLISDPNSVVAEAFRTIRNKMRFMVTNSKFKVVTITSSNTGEGKTFFAINIATAFSLSGNKTVLVGFDLRKPRLNEVFGHHSHKGVSNYLVEQAEIDDIIIQSETDNLFIIPSGPVPPNPSELLLNERTAQLFKELRKKFDIVIVDSPPIGIVADARILIDYGDTHLFVVRENFSKKDQVVNSLDSLIQEKIGGMGIIFNNVTKKNSRYGYYS